MFLVLAPGLLFPEKGFSFSVVDLVVGFFLFCFFFVLLCLLKRKIGVDMVCFGLECFTPTLQNF